ncbi:MAG: amidase [Acidimicrobiales bacterium]
MATRRRPPPVPGVGFPYLEATIAGLQADMAAGRLTARDLTVAYVDRIRELDQDGPALRSVIEVNPDAVEIAAMLDEERHRSGPRGPMHGIPVLLKDNIATADRLQTTAGSLALVGIRPTAEAHLATRLRNAGAVILGKTNLSEWANIRSSGSTSGWSARGGQTRNPYALDRNPSGSSSGSAVAITANLAVVAVGTETDGSIVSPASINGLVGLKPTVGSVSRHGIIPISHTQDTAGPMARTLADAAALLTAMAGADNADPATVTAGPATDTAGPATAKATAKADPRDYSECLDAGALRGARLGVVRHAFGDNPSVAAVVDWALEALAAAGAVLVDPVTLKHSNRLAAPEFEVLLYELNDGLGTWLRQFAPDAPVQSLRELIAWNEAHAGEELALFGQDQFEAAVRRRSLTDRRYQNALARCRRYSRDEGIDATLARHQLDALVAPTGSPAWLTDEVNGDPDSGSFSSPAAVAGYPHLTVPAGLVRGLPVGLSFVGPAWSEARLLGLGYAFEQATKARRPPTFAPTLPAPPDRVP